MLANKNILKGLFLGIVGWYSLALQAQAPAIKLSEYKELEKQGESELLDVKQEFKEFTPTGQVVKYKLLVANENLDLVPHLETEKGKDANGFYEQSTKYDPNGQPTLKEKIYMDADGKRKLRVEYTDYAINPDEVFTRIYKYTDYNKPLLTTLTDKAGKKVGEENWKYNKDNDEVQYEKWEFAPDGKKNTEEKTVTYDPATGYLLTSVLIIKENGDEMREEIIFDKNKVKEKKRLKNGQVVSTFGGNKKPSNNPNQGKTLVDFGNDQFDGIWDIVEEKDAKGRVIKSTKTEGVEVVEESTFAYDDRNNLVKSKKILYAGGEPSGQEEELVYEFDKNNNKLREAFSANGVITKEKKFKYEYY